MLEVIRGLMVPVAQRGQIETLDQTLDENVKDGGKSRDDHLLGHSSAPVMERSTGCEYGMSSPAPLRNEPTETTVLLQYQDRCGAADFRGRAAIAERQTLFTTRSASSVAQNPVSFQQRDERINRCGFKTTRKQELVLIIQNALPLILSCLLQYTLTAASIFAVGHLGKTELASISIAIMTSNLTGYVVYEGLATSLDTLCSQAYGCGNFPLVGLHLQRMILFLWCVTIAIAAIWLSSTRILLLVIPELECARLAGSYLKVVLLGAPGFAAFEAGKRFLQAQGLFFANLYVLLFCAPLNAFMNWLFVWVCRLGTTSPLSRKVR